MPSCKIAKLSQTNGQFIFFLVGQILANFVYQRGLDYYLFEVAKLRSFRRSEEVLRLEKNNFLTTELSTFAYVKPTIISQKPPDLNLLKMEF